MDDDAQRLEGTITQILKDRQAMQITSLLLIKVIISTLLSEVRRFTEAARAIIKEAMQGSCQLVHSGPKSSRLHRNNVYTLNYSISEVRTP
jgi:hypothetical protein